MRHIQSVFVALVVLAISAGAVFAGRSLSEASGAGLDRASAAAGQAVPSTPVKPDQVAPTPTPTPTPAPTTPSVALAQPAGTDEATDATTGQHPDNHGAIVSAAAHLSFEELEAACPAEFEGGNKGAYISAIARGLLVVTLDATPVAPVAPTTLSAPVAPTVTTPTVATPTITCTWPAASDATTGTSPAGTSAAGTSDGATATAPAKPHGQANADARKAARGKPSH
jgi:hypothetical protein